MSSVLLGLQALKSEAALRKPECILRLAESTNWQVLIVRVLIIRARLIGVNIGAPMIFGNSP